jgi:hypothetical protein
MVSWFGHQNQAGFSFWLRHKTDGGRLARDMRRDLAACFGVKQVWLEFLSLASRLKMGGARDIIAEVASSGS